MKNPAFIDYVLRESTVWVVQIFCYVYPRVPAKCLSSAAQKCLGQHWRSGRFNLSLRQLEEPNKPKQHLIVDGRLGDAARRSPRVDVYAGYRWFSPLRVKICQGFAGFVFGFLRGIIEE